MIYWVDDDECLLELISNIFVEFKVKTYNHWNQVPTVIAGDAVFHDHDGVGPKPEPVPLVTYYRCSGTLDSSIKVDFPKPLNFKAIKEILQDLTKNSNS